MASCTPEYEPGKYWAQGRGMMDLVVDGTVDRARSTASSEPAKPVYRCYLICDNRIALGENLEAATLTEAIALGHSLLAAQSESTKFNGIEIWQKTILLYSAPLQTDRQGIPNGTQGEHSIPDEISLYSEYWALSQQRTEIDQRLMALPHDEATRAKLWCELEDVLAELGDVVNLLAKTSASHVPALRAKACVVASLLQPGGLRDGSALPEEVVTLALSLTTDVARLPDG